MHAEQHVHIITGPNMGGKSTFMRQCATLTLLAHIGAYVPAKSMTLGVIDQIFCRVGSGDDLSGGRSTFMVEMSETAYILHNATKNSLVLMDEVGRGTSTYDGMACLGNCGLSGPEQPIHGIVRNALSRADGPTNMPQRCDKYAFGCERGKRSIDFSLPGDTRHNT